MVNHHDENSRRTPERKPVQPIQEEDERGLRNNEEACQVVCRFLLQEYEEGKQKDLESENEASEGVEGQDQDLKVKVEEILTITKEMNRV